MPKKKKNYSGNEVGTILEEIKSDFKIFGESLSDVEKKGDATFEAVGKLQEDVTTLKDDVSTLKDDVSTLKDDVSTLKDDVSTLKDDVSTLKDDVSTLKDDMGIVKSELGLIRNELKEKIGRDEFILLEKRVAMLEKSTRK
ncbi:MAG: hypothetical protein LiPW39_79 [Parcubacteria group bacterium LiPW_39]|nr:MAG: hypothetical protein LiPW39_79 [Parcubacteria group bacterium LiPW_39]